MTFFSGGSLSDLVQFENKAPLKCCNVDGEGGQLINVEVSAYEGVLPDTGCRQPEIKDLMAERDTSETRGMPLYTAPVWSMRKRTWVHRTKCNEGRIADYIN